MYRVCSNRPMASDFTSQLLIAWKWKALFLNVLSQSASCSTKGTFLILPLSYGAIWLSVLSIIWADCRNLHSDKLFNCFAEIYFLTEISKHGTDISINFHCYRWLFLTLKIGIKRKNIQTQCKLMNSKLFFQGK